MPSYETHAEKSQSRPPAQAENAMSQAAQSAWAPGSTLFKLGAVCNDTFNKSLSTQYDGLPQCAIDGVGEGFQKLKAIGLFGLGAVADAATVAIKDLQIGYESVTYPALAESNSDKLSQDLHDLQAKYAPVVSPIRQGYESIQRDLNDIGAQSNNDGAAYDRVLTDPAHNIGKAIDKFTGQNPAEQVKEIFDQGTQFAVAGALGKAAAMASGSCRLEEIAAKFDSLFSKMEETKLTYCTTSEQKLAAKNVLFSKSEKMEGGAESKSTGKHTESLETYISHPVNGADRLVPLGFTDEKQFFQAAHELTDILKRHGITDATLGVRGSSVTGYSDYKGTLFHAESDIDFYLQSAQVSKMENFKNKNFVHPRTLHESLPELKEWSNRWRAILNRPISVAAFAPEKLPKSPAIQIENH